MQGFIGCYVKNRDASDFSSNILLDKMLSAIGEHNLQTIERSDFKNFSLAVLYYRHTPYAFKPLILNGNNKHTFIDGFIKNKKNVINDLKLNSEDPLSIVTHSGMYNIVFFDESTNELKIANDRHGAKYLYYYDDEDYFIFAPNPKIILSSGQVKNKAIDYQSIISLLSHEYIMGNRSLADSIKLFPNASQIKIKDSDKDIKQYWNFEPLSAQKSSGKYVDLIEKGRSLVKNAIESYAFEDGNIIIPLSGGLDSRTIACFLSDKANCKAMHIDYGFEKIYAMKIAQTLNIDIEVYPLDHWHPWEVIDPHILCSSQSIHQFWIYPFLRNLINNKAGTMVVDGYLMNEVIGGLSTLFRAGYADINKIYPPLDHGFRFLLGDKIRQNYFAVHDSQVSETIRNCPSDIDYDKYLYFTILNYGRRFTLLFSVVHQYLCSVGLPMLDYELMDFCLKLPFEAKINSRFYRDVIVSSFPQICSIPWSRNRLPLDSSKQQNNFCYLQNKINRYKYYLTRISKSRIETLPRHNKNRRFRKDKKYREYFLNIVLDEQTFDKGYISRSGVDTLIRLIDSGRNYFDLLENVALIELVSRELKLN